ncbi:hypothetical protein OIU79_028020 [Salix purpurea]|uniref:Uncharacterized protein n=1 Tax=Salix purpurea TaxID=77065 RepID=A0A9Q0VVJ3_SALPP|nr:hypothetical protein OIU79_028020 [Salix purpurea]KAJ6755529.1 hypothetical protein OIU79_028020 [Salix purpurea]
MLHFSNCAAPLPRQPPLPLQPPSPAPPLSSPPPSPPSLPRQPATSFFYIFIYLSDIPFSPNKNGRSAHRRQDLRVQGSFQPIR